MLESVLLNERNLLIVLGLDFVASCYRHKFLGEFWDSLYKVFRVIIPKICQQTTLSGDIAKRDVT
jgi:hypothetical protein